jgi:signal peptidase II
VRRFLSSKYVLFAAIVIVGLILDQWSKWYASERLATTRPGYIEHTMSMTVGGKDEALPARQFLSDKLAANTPDEIETIARHYIRRPGGAVIAPDEKLQPGDRVVVENRAVTVVDGYWDFEYTVNPGAAFGLLSETDSPYRLPFFVVVSLLAVGVIIYLLRDVYDEQKMLIVALSFIGTGAMGNFIDRIRFGHVIDFIVWKYGDQYRWPTFNVADAFITVGVVLMLLEIFFGEPEPDPEPADTSQHESES